MTITQEAAEFVFELFKDKLSPLYYYHNFNHSLRVVNAIKELSAHEELSENQQTALLLAGWFHDTGYINGEAGHEERSIEWMEKFLSQHEINTEIVTLSKSLILITEYTKVPKTIPEFIIRDADSSHFAVDSYLSICELLREEWKLSAKKEFTDLGWAMENLKVLTQGHQYYTDYAKENWQLQKDINVALINERIKTIGLEEKNVAKNKRKKDKDGRPDRGIETMFRTTLNNHTQLSQIADSKANILLSVNAIIISIALSTLIPKLDSPSNAHLVIPTFILIFFSVVSIIFAILSTKPKVTQGAFTRKDIDNKAINLLFFGNFWKMSLDEYQWAMNEMMKDKEYLYNSMIKDLYFLGLVLHRKYKLLRITYTIFMIGIIVSVVAFVYAFYSITA